MSKMRRSTLLYHALSSGKLGCMAVAHLICAWAAPFVTASLISMRGLINT